jgi:hypothetical protein
MILKADRLHGPAGSMKASTLNNHALLRHTGLEALWIIIGYEIYFVASFSLSIKPILHALGHYCSIRASLYV